MIVLTLVKFLNSEVRRKAFFLKNLNKTKQERGTEVIYLTTLTLVRLDKLRSQVIGHPYVVHYCMEMPGGNFALELNEHWKQESC